MPVVPAPTVPSPLPAPKGKEPPRLPPPTLKPDGLTAYQVVGGEYVNLGPGGIAAADTFCPAGTKVLGGGAYNTSGDGVRLTDTYPSSDASWRAYAHNESAEAASFRAYAVCAAGVASYEIAELGVDVRPGERIELGSGCGPGRFVLGGGESNTSWGGIDLMGSYPGLEESGYLWFAYVHNRSSAAVRTRLHVICGTGLEKYHVARGSGVTIHPGGYATDTASCPAGMSVLSGGAWTSGPTSVITDSYPSPIESWRVFAHNRDPGSAARLDALVICGT